MRVALGKNEAWQKLGYNVWRYRLMALVLSGTLTGVAGALFAYETNSLSLQQFQLNKSIEFLAMLIIGGAGFPLGAMFGTGFVILLQQNIIPLVAPWFRETLPQLLPFIDAVNIVAAVNPTLFGLVLITFLIIEPRGLAHRWEILKISWKLRPYSH